MVGAGRPQGRLKGETEQADALARFVREVTAGITVRKLAQRYPAGRTSWSEYRSAEKDIPWHLLQRLIHDHEADPRARTMLLARAGHLHEQATRAAEGLRPPAAERSAAQQALDRARQAQRQAEAGVAESEELIRVLVAIVAELRSELGADATDEASPAARLLGDGEAAEWRRARLREATRCLTEVRRIRESAREVQRRAGREHDAVGLLVDQGRTAALANGDRHRAGGEPVVSEAAGTEPAGTGGVAAHLPVLRCLETDLVRVREALADRYREVIRMAPACADPRIVRGELVRAPDNRLTGPFVLGQASTGPSRAEGARAGRPRTARSAAAMGAVGAALAGVLLFTGVLVGIHVGKAAPAGSDTAPQAAGARVGPGTGATTAGPSPATADGSSPPSPPAPGVGPITSPASPPPGGTPPRTEATVPAPVTPAPAVPAPVTPAPVVPAPTDTAPPAAGPGALPEPAAPSPPGGSEKPAPSSAPTTSVPTPGTEPSPPGRLGGTPAVPPTGPVALKNGNSLQCMATPGGTRDEGREVQQYPCGDYPDHFWEAQKTYTDAEGDTYYRIVSYNSALCLSVRDSSTQAAAPVIQSTCRNNPGQSWKIEKWPNGLRFVNDNSRLCLAVTYRSTAPQAPLMQYPCGDYPDHYWSYGPRR